MPRILECGATVADPSDSPGSLIDRPRQVEFGGLLTGSGTPYRWMSLTGWDDEVSWDLSDAPRDTADGDDPGAGYAQSRIVTYDLRVSAQTPALMEEALQALGQAFRFRQAESELHVADTARHLVVDARVIARGVPHVPLRTIGVLDVSVQLKATTPLRRSVTSRTESLTVGAASGGKVFPKVYPIDWGTAAVGGVKVLPNDGTDPSPVVVTFRGPGRGHALSCGGVLLRLDLPLAATDRVRVDTRDGSVVLNGVTDRSGALSTASAAPEEWRVPPGREECVFTVADGAGPGTSADLEWFDSYM